jgi:hypothetical protein
MTSDAQILAPPATAGEGADPRRWLTLVILLLAAFMNLLDSRHSRLTRLLWSRPVIRGGDHAATAGGEALAG